MAALLTLDYLTERAQRASRTGFDRALAKVPSRAPMAGDEWPEPIEAPSPYPSFSAFTGSIRAARRAGR